MEESPGSQSGEVRSAGSGSGRSGRSGSATPDVNRVEVRGKISRSYGLRYSPSGEPLLEFTVAVPQHLWKSEMGYYSVLVRGSLAEDWSTRVKIGVLIAVRGALWSRKYKNRQGIPLQEVKVVADHLAPGA